MIIKWRIAQILLGVLLLLTFLVSITLLGALPVSSSTAIAYYLLLAAVLFLTGLAIRKIQKKIKALKVQEVDTWLKGWNNVLTARNSKANKLLLIAVILFFACISYILHFVKQQNIGAGIFALFSILLVSRLIYLNKSEDLIKIDNSGIHHYLFGHIRSDEIINVESKKVYYNREKLWFLPDKLQPYISYLIVFLNNPEKYLSRLSKAKRLEYNVDSLFFSDYPADKTIRFPIKGLNVRPEIIIASAERLFAVEGKKGSAEG
jgi:hypothetical protein